MQFHEMERQMAFFSTIYHTYRHWLQSNTSKLEDDIHMLCETVCLIEQAIINMQEKERIYLADLYFIGNDEMPHANNAWKHIKKDVKIKVMSSFFRCLKG